jgi:hypothetical protein
LPERLTRRKFGSVVVEFSARPPRPLARLSNNGSEDQGLRGVGILQLAFLARASKRYDFRLGPAFTGKHTRKFERVRVPD